MPVFDIAPGANPRAPGSLSFGHELDQVPPFNVDTDGLISWGDGVNARDVSLGRSAAGTLNVTGTLNVNGSPISGGGVVSASTGFITSGDINVNTSFTQIGTDVTIAAAAGDVLALTIEALCANTGDDCQFEAATRVGGSDTNWWSTGGAASRWPGGLGNWYVQTGRFDGPRGSSIYTVQAGDVVAGAVTVRVYGRCPASARVVNANANYPVRWRLDNLG